MTQLKSGIALLAIILSLGCSGSPNKPEKPNILFIMSDDHASKAISSYDSYLTQVFKTPNIDRIAQEGARLNHCYVTNSICTPSRASILTGTYSHKNGVYTLGDDLDKNMDNVAKYLQAAGYETAIVGKWHLHTEPTGFDYYNVLPNQGDYFNPKLKEKGKEWKDRKKGGEVYEGYVTDVITDISIEWLDQRDTEKPFFLMSHHKAPHGLWEYHQKYEHLFDGLNIPEPGSLFEDLSHRSEASRDYGRDMLQLAERMSGKTKFGDWPTGNLETEGLTEQEIIEKTYQKYMKDYLRVLASVDENVGRLLDYLDTNNLTENTVVIYTSDQGMFLGEHGYYDKRWMFEEAHQMPFVIRYPKEIRPKTNLNDMVTNVDFASLFLDYAEFDQPSFFQGRSFRSNLTGETPEDWPESVYYRYWMHLGSNIPAHMGVRTKDFKLILYYGLLLDMKSQPGVPEQTTPGWELYDLKKDPLEMNNVYNNPEYKEEIKKLKELLIKHRQDIGDTDDKYPEVLEILNS